MNIFDLFETPGMGHPRDTKGIQSAADQSAASVIGSGTTEREEKKKPVRMMGKSVKESVELDEGTPVNMNALMARGDRATGPWWARAGDLNYMGSTESNKTLQYKLYFPDMFSSRALTMFDDNKDKLLKAAREHHMEQDDNGEWFYPVYRKTEATKHEISALKYMFGEKIIKKAADEVEEAAVKPNFKMPPESLQDKMYRQHQELRKQRGAPSPEEYKERIAQKQKEIDDLKEGILDRAAPKLPKPRNPADQVLQTKVNAGGRHLDKKRRQELNPKHKHQDPLEEGAISNAIASAALAGSMALGGAAHAGEPVVGQGQSQNMQMAVDMAKHNAKIKYMKTVYGDNFQDKQMPEYRFGKVDLKPGKDGGYQATVPIIVDSEVQNESLRPGEHHTWTVHFADGTSQQVNVPSDEFDVRAYFAKRNKQVVKVDRNYAIQGQQQDAPQRAKDDPAARADQERKAHIQHDRGLTEQDIEEEFRLGKKLGTRRDRFKSLRKRKDGILGEEDVDKVSIGDRKWPLPKGDHDDEMPGDANDDEMGLDETIRKINNQYRLYSKKGKNLGTFDSKDGAEKHEREVQYFKHMKEGTDNKFVVTCYNSATDDKETILVSADDEYDAKDKINYALGRGSQIVDVRPARGDEPTDREYKTYKHPTSGQSRTGIFDRDQDVDEGWKGKLAGAALAGAAALGGGDVDAQNIDLPGPQVSYIAHVIADVNGREVNKTVNLGSQYQSKEQVEQDLEEYMQSKGITRYSIRVEQSYDQPSGYGQRRSGGSYATGGDYATAPIYAPGLGDMIAGRVSREIRAGIPDRGGYATGGSTKGQRPRDGSQWWRDQLPPMMREEALEEDIERHLLQMRRAGYDIVQEEWSDKYKDSINCSNPKGFSQKAHCAGKKKNEDVSEEKVRLDPKCWKGKKIGNPKTKMKGGVRVNNCVPK